MTAFFSIEHLCVTTSASLPILRDVNLQINAGEVHGLVGESGAGKSMIGKSVLGILPSALQITNGRLLLDGVDLQTLPARQRRQAIGINTALIPQDPLTALNPVRRIGAQIIDRLVQILGWRRGAAKKRALELLDEVQMPNPEQVMRSYPHELSGGMRQRILIASAFATEPKLIIADEPTTALDANVQKQVLKLIKELQLRHGTALLFVTHDLGVVSKVCQSLSVLYDGMVLEHCSTSEFFKQPRHPYSQALLNATPRYTDPEGSLLPVPAHVIKGVKEQISAFDNGTASV